MQPKGIVCVLVIVIDFRSPLIEDENENEDENEDENQNEDES